MQVVQVPFLQLQIFVMASNKKTVFNSVWLMRSNYKEWLVAVDNDLNSACCKLCSKTFTLGNMGEKAVNSHANGKKHKRNVENLRSSSIKIYGNLSSPAKPVHDSLSSKPVVPSPSLDVSSKSIPNMADVSTVTLHTQSSAPKQPRGLEALLQRDQVTKSEIIWCLHLVMSHGSYRSGGEAVHLFPTMFPDSQIASSMKLQRTKIGYVITFGLAPYFYRELNQSCTQSDYIVIGFDESLNKVAQKGQMDFFVKFWNSEKNLVDTRYYNSTFLGHATASDLLKSFEEGTKDLNLRKLLQLSMDGPNVNLKFFKELKALLLEEDADRPVLLNIGTCGIHHVHNAYKKSMKKSGWKVMEFLRSLYYLFLHVPSRRADYIKYSASTVFPLKFCAVRWVENFSVAARAIQVIPHVRNYIRGVKKDKKEPTCNSYKIVCAALEDKLLCSKLAFFQTIASDLEHFLTSFQSSDPLSPLLYESMLTTLRSVLNRFVKDDVLDNSPDLVRIDIGNPDNLKAVKLVDVGFSVKSALRKVDGLKAIDLLQFRKDCREALIEFFSSLTKNSSLMYRLTKGISCFDPSIAVNPKLRLSRLGTALDIFVDNKWISGHSADQVKNNCIQIWKRPFFEEKMKSFSLNDPNKRLDKLWFEVIPESEEFLPVRNFLKMVLIFSHGNAFIERGFSINK